MKVLFLIPKNNPPTLEGNYSKPLKEFVEACLNKEPSFVSVPLSVVSSRGEFALWGLFQSLLAVSLISLQMSLISLNYGDFVVVVILRVRDLSCNYFVKNFLASPILLPLRGFLLGVGVGSWFSVFTDKSQDGNWEAASARAEADLKIVLGDRQGTRHPPSLLPLSFPPSLLW